MCSLIIYSTVTEESTYLFKPRMVSNELNQFEVDIERPEISPTNFIQSTCLISARIRVFADGVCLTHPRGKHGVADYLPYHCTKLLNGVRPILSGETQRVPYAESVCDLYFHPQGDTVLVSAQRTDGTPLNPNVPEDGCAVAKEAVVAEIIDTSETVKRWFEGLSDVESYEHYREFKSALRKARAVRDSNSR